MFNLSSFAVQEQFEDLSLIKHLWDELDSFKGLWSPGLSGSEKTYTILVKRF